MIKRLRVVILLWCFCCKIKVQRGWFGSVQCSDILSLFFSCTIIGANWTIEKIENKCHENLINFTGCLAYHRNLAEESKLISLSERVECRWRYGEEERAKWKQRKIERKGCNIITLLFSWEEEFCSEKDRMNLCDFFLTKKNIYGCNLFCLQFNEGYSSYYFGVLPFLCHHWNSQMIEQKVRKLITDNY